MKVEVKVTANDIYLGIRRDASACPIARALYLTNDKFKFVVVGRYGCRMQFNGIWMKAPTPDSAAIFMGDFDNREDVEPITFNLDFEEMYNA